VKTLLSASTAALLKTARAREGPRGFESHALRAEHLKRFLTSGDAAGSRYFAVWLCLAASGRLRLAVPNTCPSCVGSRPGRFAIDRRLGGFFDSPLGLGLLPGDALG